MNDGPDRELLLELAKLLRRFGPEPFESLSKLLAKEETIGQIRSLLNEMAAASRALPQSRKAKQQKQSTRGFLEVLRDSDRRKYDVLQAFSEGFISGSLMPSLRDVKRFIEEWKLPEIRANSRQKALGPLIRALSTLPTETIISRLEGASHTYPADRDLSDWSRIILDRERAPKASE